MGQLLKVTSVPLQTIHFTQNARLVPADNMDIERRKAMARHFAFHSRYSGKGGIDLEYVNQVNKAFSTGHSSSQSTVSMPVQGTAPAAGQTAQMAGLPLAGSDQAVKYPAPDVPAFREGMPSVSGRPAARPAPQPDIPEPQAAYTMQRGSFELRVAKGELSYVPPLVMTIITQYPEIHFEYMGGYNYFPPQNDSSDGNMNLSI